ncbi:MAG: hypothetical protein ACI4GD_01525 [Lachnospiraceae bacterium]
MKSKTWNIIVLVGMICTLGFFAGVTILVDPLFHYHAPLDSLAYPIDDERYQNDGIVRHFDYDAVIAGSSMCENFSSTEFDNLWGTKCVKVPLSGGTYREADLLVRRALETHPGVRYVLRSLDYSSLLLDKYELFNADIQPSYLYDNNPLNDVEYLFNKEIFITKVYEVLNYTRHGGRTTTFDDYANWNSTAVFGAEEVLSYYDWTHTVAPEQVISEEEINRVHENIYQNVVETANNYPDVTFYYFFTPYSIAYWAMLNERGQINWRIDAEKYAIEDMLECPNIKLYSFCTDYATVCELGNYKDLAHFDEEINHAILHRIRNDEYLLTKDNYEQYIDEIREFYNSYDYESLTR